MTIIYLTDSYKGGANNFLEQNIKYNLSKKKKVVVINNNYLETFPNIKKDKNLKYYNLDIFDDKKKIKKLIKSFNKNNNIFFFTNYAILVYYFFSFLNLEKNRNKFAIALHSGVFNYNLKTILGIFLFSIFALRLDYIIFGSNSSKQWWLSFFPWFNKINNKIIFNGVEKRNVKKRKKKIFKISFIGRLEHENDPELFLNLYQINKNKKNMQFNIFGDGSLKKKFQNKFAEVKFWGWSKQKKIYLNTDICVITSPINNFPYVALESNSYGIPVLTAARGDIRKIVKNNYSGYILKERTVENFDFFLRKTINNYKKLSKNSFENAKKYEVNKSCQKIWRYLEIDNYNSR